MAALSVWRPLWGLAGLLALWPVADDSILTGWRHLGGWDGLVAAVGGGIWVRRGHAAFAARSRGGHGAEPAGVQSCRVRGSVAFLVVWTLWTLWVAWRTPTPPWGALVDVLGGDHASWFAPWRGLLTWFSVLGLCIGAGPWIQSRRAQDVLAIGMWAGLLLTLVAVVHERATQVGVLDLSQPYRTTAWFWEMHFGGGALDAYLAMAVPFAWWAWSRAKTPGVWWGMAAIQMVMVYGVVTTYSRGIIGVAMLTSLYWAWAERHVWRSRPHWWRLAYLGVWLAMVLETVVLLGSGSYLPARMERAQADVLGRWQHWREVGALPRGQLERAFGIGLGQLPGRYAQEVPGGEMPGRVTWVAASGQVPSHVRLQGPPTRPDLAARFELTQRQSSVAVPPTAVSLRYRADHVTTLRVAWCDQHLLYEGHCREASPELPPTPIFTWVGIPLSVETEGDVGSAKWRPASPHLLKMAVDDVGAAVDIQSVALSGPSGVVPLVNAQFQQGLAQWWPTSNGYFLPWHADNLYLELFVERGWGGLLCWIWGLGLVWCNRATSILPLWLGVVAMSGLGVVISVFEFPRTAFLYQFLVVLALYSGRRAENASS